MLILEFSMAPFVSFQAWFESAGVSQKPRFEHPLPLTASSPSHETGELFLMRTAQFVRPSKAANMFTVRTDPLQVGNFLSSCPWG